LGYAGSLGLGYRDGLLAICDALASTRTTLNIYTRDQHCLVNHPQIVNRGFFTSDRLWPNVQSECDVVLLPYAFEGQMTRVYRTHFPTKLSDVLLARDAHYRNRPRGCDRSALGFATFRRGLGGNIEGYRGARTRFFSQIRDDGEQRMSMAGASQRMPRSSLIQRVSGNNS